MKIFLIIHTCVRMPGSDVTRLFMGCTSPLGASLDVTPLDWGKLVSERMDGGIALLILGKYKVMI